MEPELINSPRSPYAFFEAETYELESPAEQVTSDDLSYLLRTGFISEKENYILKAISAFKLLNTKQLFDCLMMRGITKSKKALECLLKKLTQKGFIKRIAIKRKEQVTAIRYEYLLDNNAKLVLGDSFELFDTSKLSMAGIKRMLATNQLVISAMQQHNGLTFSLYDSIDVKYGLLNINHCSIFYDALIKTEGCNYFVITVRRSNDWQKELTANENTYKFLAKSKNIGKIIFLCEDSQHINEVKELIKQSKKTIFLHDRNIHFSDFNTLVSAD